MQLRPPLCQKGIQGDRVTTQDFVQCRPQVARLILSVPIHVPHSQGMTSECGMFHAGLSDVGPNNAREKTLMYNMAEPCDGPSKVSTLATQRREGFCPSPPHERDGLRQVIELHDHCTALIRRQLPQCLPHPLH